MKLYFYCSLPKELILITKRNTNIKIMMPLQDII